MQHSIPSIDFLEPHLRNDDAAYDYLIAEGVIISLKNTPCPVCYVGKMKKDPHHPAGSYRCFRKECQHRASAFQDTIFLNRNLPLNKILQIFHLWCAGCNIKIIEILSGTPHTTVCHWIGRLKQVIKFDIDSLDEEDRKIGGGGITVEVDESKCGKHGPQVGHPVLGVWVGGGVERTGDKRVFFEVLHDRTAGTLREMIRDNVQPGTIVNTDCWRGYRTRDIQAMEMQHQTVNHSEHYVDPQTGAHTQRIEATWRVLKTYIPHRCERPNLVVGYLAKFVWRRFFATVIWKRLLVAVCGTSIADIHEYLNPPEELGEDE